MKKIIFSLLVLMAALAWSCKDTSGDYIEQMYTDAMLSKGVKACMTVSKDTAAAHLCVAEGMNAHAISFPNSGQYRAVRDTLAALGQSELLDTLYSRITRSCELMGDNTTTIFNTAIEAVVFDNPSDLVYGPQDTITHYLKLYKGAEIQSSVSSALSTHFGTTGAISTWNEIIALYNANSTTTLTIDLNGFVAARFLEAFYTEMAAEELLIRTDASHRVTENLKKIFGEIGESKK